MAPPKVFLDYDQEALDRAYDQRAWAPNAKEIIDSRRRLDEIIAKHTGQKLEKVANDTERDYFMSADEAVEYHLVDRVIDHR